jgi:hypothetical protein
MRREGAKTRKRENAKEDAKKMKNPVGFPIFLNSFASCFALSRRMFWQARNRARLFSTTALRSTVKLSSS